MGKTTKSFCQLVFATREKHLGQIWKTTKLKPNKGIGYRDYTDFKLRAQEARQLYAEYREGGFYYQDLRKNFDENNSAGEGTSAGPSDANNGNSPKRKKIDSSTGEGTVSSNDIETDTDCNIDILIMDVDVEKSNTSQSGTSRGPNTEYRKKLQK